MRRPVAHIALWEGSALEEIHRPHSHLAGIAPFETLDLDDPAWQPIVRVVTGCIPISAATP
jgi:hypothetical protein